MAAPENLRILRVRGNSMEPEMREGDRLVVDVSRRVPATGEMFVLWDGNGLVVKRIEAVRGEPPRLRLISANPGLRALYLSRRGRPHHRKGDLGRAGGCEPHLLEAGNRWATM